MITRAVLPVLTTIVAMSLTLQRQPEATQTNADQTKTKPTSSLEDDLARLKDALASGKLTTHEVMASTDWAKYRENPRFRKRIRDYTKDAKTVAIPADVPGTPLVVSGVVRDDRGAAVGDALVYAFQTSDNGSYSTRGGNAADMGDSLNPRLFAYMKTGPDGRYEFRTIRPGQYPNDGPPAHIHFEIAAPGFKTQITEVMFEDDSRMTAPMKQSAVQSGFVVQSPAKGSDGLPRVTADWTLTRS